jgi:hypothetical protein
MSRGSTATHTSQRRLRSAAIWGFRVLSLALVLSIALPVIHASGQFVQSDLYVWDLTPVLISVVVSALVFAATSEALRRDIAWPLWFSGLVSLTGLAFLALVSMLDGILSLVESIGPVSEYQDASFELGLDVLMVVYLAGFAVTLLGAVSVLRVRFSRGRSDRSDGVTSVFAPGIAAPMAPSRLLSAPSAPYLPNHAAPAAGGAPVYIESIFPDEDER